jgi:hypothetical protein
MIFLFSMICACISIPRAPRRNLPRVNWQAFAADVNDFEFQNEFRFSRRGFVELLRSIVDLIESDHVMAARCSSGPIMPEIKLAITLRLCAGARWQDLRRIYRVSKKSVYTCFHSVIDAINYVDDISIRLDDELHLSKLSAGFDRNSDGLLKGCITVIDGYAIPISKPKLRDCPNPSSYYCRKGFYSIVLQAGCDANRRFTFASMLCAGATHDSVAFEMTALARAIRSPTWPSHFFIGGDAAYSPCENLVTPYLGKQLDAMHDSFNYYFSGKLRINIECAFGMLWMRWLILQRPLSFSLDRIPKIMLALLKLHNRIVDLQLDESYLPEATNKYHFQSDCHSLSPGSRTDLLMANTSVCRRRDTMRDLLGRMGWVRPPV